MSRFDSLPLEVIKHYIFPCLDYEGRINLNKACLSKDEYIRTRLKMEEVLRVQLLIITTMLRHYTSKIHNYKSQFHKHKHHLILIDKLMKYTSILKYHKNVRLIIVYKYSLFADDDYPEYARLKEKYKIVDESKRLLKHIELFPFIRTIPLDLLRYNNWSPIHTAYVPDRPDLMSFA